MALADGSSLREPLSPAYPDIGAQVVFGVRQEHCLRLDDFLRRRTLLGATPDRGAQAIVRAAALMAQELGWQPAREASEVARARHSPGSDLDFRN
jgi:glycerol-3-phosphate dehydrogenase